MSALPSAASSSAVWLRCAGEGLLWLLLSGLLVILSTWPMAAQVQGHLLEPLHLPDVQGGMFWPWAFSRSWGAGGGVYWRPELMWPSGQDIRLIVWNHGVQVLIAPLHRWLEDPISATNLSALWLATLNGLACAWAGWTASRTRWGALAGLAVGACAPYGVVESGVGRPEQGFWGPLALCLGGFVRLWSVPSSRGGRRACGLGMALAGAVYWFYALFLLVLLGAVVPVGLLLSARGERAARLWALLGAGLIAVVAVSPLLVPVVWAVAGTGGETSVVAAAIASNAPVSEMQARAPLLLPWGHLGPWASGMERGWRAPLLALPACLLALLAGRGLGGGVRGVAAMGVLAAVLAAGPLWLGPDGAPVGSGAGVAIWLPHRLLSEVPGFDRFWWPYRWQAPLLAAAVVSLGALLGRLGARWRAAAALGVVVWSLGESAVMLRDGGIRPVMGPAQIAPLFPAIGAMDPSVPRPILQLPSAWLRNSRVGWIAWHHQPIDGGMGLGMLPDRAAAHQASLAHIPLVAQVLQAASQENGDMAVVEAWDAETSGGYHYVLLYSEGPTAEREALGRGLRRVLGAPFYTDRSVRAWRVPGMGEIPPGLEETAGE